MRSGATAAARGVVPLLGIVGVLGGGCLDVIGDVDVDGTNTAFLSSRAAEDCSDADAAAGLCVVRCEPNQTRCSDNLLQRCNEQGNAWALLDQCGSAALCDEVAVSCGTPVCAPREHRCTAAGVLEACSADRTRFEELEACRSAAFCSPVAGREGCLGTACRAGREQCNGPQIERCREDRSGFDKVGEPCASAALCREGGMEFPVCVPPACAPGQFACEGAVLSRCSEDAVRYVPIAECASAAACDAAGQRCVASDCTPGAQICRAAVLERCTDAGVFAPVADCRSPELCDPNAMACLAAPPVVTPPDPSVLDGAAYRFQDVTQAAVLGLGPLQLDVPAEWTDIDQRPWTSATGTTLGPRFIASRDAARFSLSFDIPGVYFAATSVAPLDVESRMAEFDLTGRCTLGTSSSYSDELYVGRVQNWTNCGPTAARTAVVVANDREEGRLVTVVIVTMTAARDDDAREQIWDSFEVH
ncbi:MAG TPA: hypothetical protein VNN80_11125 [Polyangiaceae bacterium]|nr:hypothetical protein [Polyangiaceae bacterium]